MENFSIRRRKMKNYLNPTIDKLLMLREKEGKRDEKILIAIALIEIITTIVIILAFRYLIS
jgi:hypothetical protein